MRWLVPGAVDEYDRNGCDARPEARRTALFDGYLEPDRPYSGAFDEMFHADGRSRSASCPG